MGKPYRSTALCLLLLLAACPTSRKQLENVAKDWSLLIRASQVIPIYPLTEDLQPGDIFLVETPIQEQANEYEEKGYLRLDQQLGRLQRLDYWRFYGEGGYGLEENSRPPRNWQQATPAQPAANGPVTHRDPTHWSEAPRAAFPTYNFSIKQGQGLDLALPIQGVPVGLSLMRTKAANGMVTIADTYTYGVSLDELNDQVRLWAKRRREILGDFRASTTGDIYLRVVNRVYLTGRVVIAMTNSESAGGDLAAGAGSTERQALFDLSEGEGETRKKATAAAYTDMLTNLNTSLSDTLPKGRIKVVGASSRSVSLSETFDRPLVIGYLSFDYPILESGLLGAPVATRDVLRRKGNVRKIKLGEPSDMQLDYSILIDALKSWSEADQKTICDLAAEALGGSIRTAYDTKVTGGRTPALAFDSVTAMPPQEFTGSTKRWRRHVYDALRDAVTKTKRG